MREADIRPRALLDEYLRLSAADVDALFSNHDEMQRAPCPACDGDKINVVFEKNKFSISRCHDCGTLYVNPRPSEVQLNKFYRDSKSTAYWSKVFFPAVADARREKIFAPRAHRILQVLDDNAVPAGQITDVGAGAGLFLQEVAARCPTVALRAVEPGAELAQVCRDHGIRTFEGFAADATQDPAWAGKADLVTSFEVIEHTVDTAQFVSDLGALARPGGLILITGLCADGFDIQCLGPASDAISPPHHLTFLSQVGVRRLMERIGLELIDFSTPGQLDVDIVANKLADRPELIDDPFLNLLMHDTSDETRHNFQRFLAENQLSSHMWILARRRPS